MEDLYIYFPKSIEKKKQEFYLSGKHFGVVDTNSHKTN